MGAVITCKLILHADGSMLVRHGKDFAEVKNTFNEELHKTQLWLEENNPSIRNGKPEIILLGIKKT